VKLLQRKTPACGSELPAVESLQDRSPLGGSPKETGNRRTLAHQVDIFTKSLRHDYAPEVARDARVFKRRVVELVRRGLPPGPGHPRDDVVTRAVELRAQHKSWCYVYRQCIPGFSHLSDEIQQLARIRLRSAVRSRKIRQQRRNASKRRARMPQGARSRSR